MNKNNGWNNCNKCNEKLIDHEKIHGVCNDCRLGELQKLHFINMNKRMCVTCTERSFQVENLNQNGKYCNRCLYDDKIVKY